MLIWKIFITFLMIALSVCNAHAITTDSNRIMITAPSQYGVDVGEQIAKKGGNVADVAVAVGLALAVTTPYYASLGGGGFAMIRMGKNPIQALDFRETAPAKTSSTFFTEDPRRSSEDGGAAVAVPGNPMGLYEIHKKYGRLPWRAVVEPSVRLSNQGFELSGEWIAKTLSEKARFNAAGTKNFFKKNGEMYKPGEVFKQPILASVFQKLRDQGPLGFYEGAVAEDIVKSVKNTGGVITLEDLKKYKVRWLEPISAKFAGYDLFLMPPPSSGGVVIQKGLGLIESRNLVKHAFLSSAELSLLGEIEKEAFHERTKLGDPDFLKKESTETTHFNVMDADGNAISLTYTLNGNYGSGVVSEKFRIALNNEMDDFTTKPGLPNQFGLVQGEANKVEPGKRPLSSMSPTLVLKDGQTFLALGAPGGPRIISGVFQVLYRVLGQNLDLDVAVQAPRVHHQFLPDTLYLDRQRLSPDVISALKKKGHKVEEGWMGKVSAIQRTGEGVLKAAFDSRGEGAAAGY